MAPPVANDPDLVMDAVSSMKSILGEDKVYQVDPATVAEDFGRYGRTKENIPIALFWLGSSNHEQIDDQLKNGTKIPALHNAGFSPEFKPTFRGGVAAMSKTMIQLFNSK